MNTRAIVRGTPSPTATPVATLVPVSSPPDEDAAVAVDELVDEDINDGGLLEEEVVVVAVDDESDVEIAVVDEAVDAPYVRLGTLSCG